MGHRQCVQRSLHFNPEDPAAHKNELFNRDPSDLRRLSPMEPIIPEEEGESSSPSQTDGGEEKRAPEGRVTDGRVSWPDVAVLVCAAPAMSILAAAWGIFVLLTAAGTVVLEFGGSKGKSEPVCHATEDRTSWTDVVVRLFTGLAESFQAVKWPCWWELVIGAVVSVWGFGSFALLANEVSTKVLGWHGSIGGGVCSGCLSSALGGLDLSCCLRGRSGTTDGGLLLGSSEKRHGWSFPCRRLRSCPLAQLFPEHPSLPFPTLRTRCAITATSTGFHKNHYTEPTACSTCTSPWVGNNPDQRLPAAHSIMRGSRTRLPSACGAQCLGFRNGERSPLTVGK